MISNCGSLTEKCSEFLDHFLGKISCKMDGPILRILETVKKINNLDSIPENAIFVTVDVMGLYPIILYELGFRALREVLDKTDEKATPKEELLKMEFVLKTIISNLATK